MQRETKFRAYDKRTKELIDLLGFKYVGKSQIQLFYLDIDGDYASCTCEKEFIELMQYTGLKDKNGKEIYEGDIFRLGDKNILYIVVWQDTGLKGKQARASSYVGLEHWKDRIETVGNVYDNPELLQEED